VRGKKGKGFEGSEGKSTVSESTEIDGEVLGFGFGIARPDGSIRGEGKEGMRGGGVESGV
jgi:hypothetical protein